MKKCINNVVIEGYLYQHSLSIRTVQDQNSENYGKEFINGSIDIATDETGLNVIPIRYTYVTATTKNGSVNRTYTVLKEIIDKNQTWINVGKDKALKVKCDTAFALNDFYAKDGTLVSSLVQEGGFISVVTSLRPEESRNTFTLDFLITSVARIEADPEKNITDDYCNVRGAGFNFRNSLLPMTLMVKNPDGMNYFEDLGATNSDPVFIKVWGKILNRTTKVEKVEESAFGESSVSSYERKVKEWIITGVAKESYDFGDENILTFEDVTKAIQDREVYLADVKKRAEDYANSKNTVSTAPAAESVTNVSKKSFNF
jgi:hypothetical protein